MKPFLQRIVLNRKRWIFMKNISLQVEKMSCGNCLETVENALKEVSGVTEAKRL
jgi:hypothetical protein